MADRWSEPKSETAPEFDNYCSLIIHCKPTRFDCILAVMIDRGFMLTARAIRRQLAAMPHDLYLIRLIQNRTRQALPGKRWWTANQLLSPATTGFLRARNREGYDIYVRPDAWDQNAGYILVDLDRAEVNVLDRMRPFLEGRSIQTSPVWSPASQRQWPGCWPASMKAIRPALTGATWAGLPGSRIGSRLFALTAVPPG